MCAKATRAASTASWHAAIDLGASGGRVALGRLEEGRLEVEVLHRFPNRPVPIRGGLYWDVVGLWAEALEGLRLAGARALERGGAVASVGADAWAVDFALLDERGHLIDGVRCYRDPRTDGVMDGALERLPRARLFELTGLQFLPFNTLYQLLALERDAPGSLARAHGFLMVPDVLHYWLTGRVTCERTNASTTQFYDPRTGAWSQPVLGALGLPDHLLPRIVEAGTRIGPVSRDIARIAGLERASVVAPGTHDTASAVAATPLADAQSAYISSGTWSLVGLETGAPVINAAALESNLTNEAGVNGTNRLLKNVMGLWILQECRRTWGNPDWAALYRAAAEAPAFEHLVDPDDPRFLAPGDDMPGRVRAYCLETGQAAPETQAALARCVLEGLALKYRLALGQLQRASGTTVSRIHVVGGGSQIALLNQFAADATGCEVVAGPVDATLTGNILAQAVGCGALSWSRLRDTVRASFALETFAPRNSRPWDRALERFSSLLNPTPPDGVRARPQPGAA